MPTLSLPSVSVILVSYRTGPYLFDCIDTILRQPGVREIIVVDNGNPPDVLGRLHDITEQRGESFKVVSGHGNIGFGRGVNLGAANSGGDYLLILNPDCLLRGDAVARLIGQASSLHSPFMIGARILNQDGSDQRGCRRELLTPATALIEALHLGRLFPRLRLNLHETPMPDRMENIPAISGAFMFLPRKDFDLIGGFDESYFLHVEDLDFCFRFRKAGGDIYFAPDVVVTHIGGTSSVSSDFIERAKARSFVHYFRVNFGGSYPPVFFWCLNASIWARYYMRRWLGASKRSTK